MPVGKGSIARATSASNKMKVSPVKSQKIIQDILSKIRVDQIHPVPDSWRKSGQLMEYSKELVQSIQKHGMLEPVILRRIGDDQFQLLSGYKRLQVIKDLGDEFISSRVMEKLSDQEAKEIFQDLHGKKEKKTDNIHEYKFKAVSSLSNDLPTYLL